MDAKTTMLHDKVKKAKQWLEDARSAAQEHIKYCERTELEHDQHMLDMVTNQKKWKANTKSHP